MAPFWEIYQIIIIICSVHRLSMGWCGLHFLQLSFIGSLLWFWLHSFPSIPGLFVALLESTARSLSRRLSRAYYNASTCTGQATPSLLFRASREASEATGMADLTDNARIFPGTDQWDENVVQKWAGNTRGVSEGCCPTPKKTPQKKTAHGDAFSNSNTHLAK